MQQRSKLQEAVHIKRTASTDNLIGSWQDSCVKTTRLSREVSKSASYCVVSYLVFLLTCNDPVN